MSSQVDDALVLKIYPYAESDGVVVFLTRQHGKIRLLVHGLRSLKRQQHGVISPFNRVSLSFTSRGPDQLGNLVESTLQRGVDIGGGELSGFYFLSYMYEVILGMEIEPGVGPLLFRLLDAMTSSVAASGFRIDRLCYFQFWLLRLEGLVPEPGVCDSCGSALGENCPAAVLDPERLRFRCRNCLVEPPSGDIHNAAALSIMFQGFLSVGPENIIYLPIETSEYIELILFLDSKITNLIGKKSKSLPLVLGSIQG